MSKAPRPGDLAVPICGHQCAGKTFHMDHTSGDGGFMFQQIYTEHSKAPEQHPLGELVRFVGYD